MAIICFLNHLKYALVDPERQCSNNNSQKQVGNHADEWAAGQTEESYQGNAKNHSSLLDISPVHQIRN